VKLKKLGFSASLSLNIGMRKWLIFAEAEAQPKKVQLSLPFLKN